MTERTVQDVIREITFVESDGQAVARAYFHAQTGFRIGVDEVDWEIFDRDGKLAKKVTLPRGITCFLREPEVCFWLLDIPEAFVSVYGLDDLVLTEDAVNRHKERIEAAWEAYGRKLYFNPEEQGYVYSGITERERARKYEQRKQRPSHR